MGSRILRFNWTILHQEILGGKIVFYDCDPHFHDTYTIGLLRKGRVRLTCDDQVFMAEPGDIFLVHPYEVHGGGNTCEPAECDILYPTMDLMAEATGVALYNGNYPYFASPLFKKSKSTAHLFKCIDRASAMPSVFLPETGICEVLRDVFGPYVQGTRRLKLMGGERPSVYMAFEAMLQQFESMRGAADITEQLGVSPYHFSRIFHKAVGVPPSVFLRQLRVAKARALITNGEALADVAVDAGFFDQAHMTREFKSVFGFPPGTLARKVRETRLQA